MFETSFTPIQSLGGGALIGLAAVLLMLGLGRIFGATGILSGLVFFENREELSWRAALVIGISGAEVISHYWSSGWAVITGTVLLLLITLDLHSVSATQPLANKLSAALVAVATTSLVAVSMFSPSSLITVSGVVVLAAVIAFGYLYRFNLVTVMGSIGTVAIAIMNAEELWSTVAQTGWWGIAAGGAAAIVAGSMLDRAGTVVEAKS